MKWTFDTNDSWSFFSKGKMKAEVDFAGRIWHLVTPRGRQIYGDDECREWLEEHGLDDELRHWVQQRQFAVCDWLHETPHMRFECDGGSLAVRVNGCCTVRVNCGADGNHPVYVTTGEVPPFFESCGFSLDECTIEPLDYDCDGGKPLCQHVVKSAWFYRHGSAILIKIEVV